MFAEPPEMIEITDRYLVAAAQGGDRHAIESLMHRYERRVLAIVRALRLPRGVEPDDVAQAARLGLLGAIRSWRPGGPPFRRYAGICARRRAVDAIDASCTARSRALTNATSLDALAEAGHEPTIALQGAPAVADPFATLLAREQLAAMGAALPTLSGREAECLKGELNGRPYPELAAGIGGTTKAVATAVRRGRHKLAAAAGLRDQ
jgi:RNA polymerase sigma factor (sigma-70 family)